MNSESRELCVGAGWKRVLQLPVLVLCLQYGFKDDCDDDDGEKL